MSNVNGHVEPMRELCELAHARGALVYADIIQAAGIVPVDLRELGVDFAACSAYKWLYGPHGVGFFYARKEHQGSALVDRMFPGHARHNYPPWSEDDSEGGDFLTRPQTDATRYTAGHVSYLGYSAVHESLGFLGSIGVDGLLAHSVALNRRLLERLDGRLECISPHVDRSPIVTFRIADPEGLAARLAERRIVASLGPGRLRVSPGIYNTEADVDVLAEALLA